MSLDVHFEPGLSRPFLFLFVLQEQVLVLREQVLGRGAEVPQEQPPLLHPLTGGFS